MATIAFIPRRLNEPPVVFRGMTGREVVIMSCLGFSAGVPVGVISAFVMGAFAMVPTVAFLAAGLFVWFGGTVMRRVRRGRSTVWFYRHLQWKLAVMGLPIGEGRSLIVHTRQYQVRKDKRMTGGRT